VRMLTFKEVALEDRAATAVASGGALLMWDTIGLLEPLSFLLTDAKACIVDICEHQYRYQTTTQRVIAAKLDSLLHRYLREYRYVEV